MDEFFTWLAAQAARVSRKSDLGIALAYMLKRQDGFRLFLDDGHVDRKRQGDPIWLVCC